MSGHKTTKFARLLGQVLAESELDELGKAAGQSKRLRVVTPFRLVCALLVALGQSTTESIADLCREFNFQTGTATAYKAFYNRLARPSFPKFMRAVAMRLMSQLAVRMLAPSPDGCLVGFRDVVVQDGSSFVLKPALSRAFPGRFKNVDPAAVEIHATFSGYRDGVIALHIAPDTVAERYFLPKAAELTDKLLLADRGYPSRPYFQAIDQAGGHFIVRLSRSFMPWVLAAHHGDACVPMLKPVRLPEFLSQHPHGALDLDVEMRKGKKAYRCRIIVLPGKEKYRTRLCTNLPRGSFSMELVSRLYRFRWQIELLFKEWKSYANLRKFDTANKHIARGLIWASLAAAILKRFIAHAAEATTRAPISTRKVAMSARLFLRPLCMALSSPRRLGTLFATAINYLAANALRADSVRDSRRGRLNAGLVQCAVVERAA